jgi:formate hydrogenlyase transcriptional activator
VEPSRGPTAAVNFEEITGQSPEMKRVFKLIETVAPTDATVLLVGETGTGKELVARALHNLSSRRHRTLVKVNCAALPAGLIESELFGHEKGAFTGALTRRAGRFELAHGGTLFLDEIGDLPLELQPKLLRVLQEGEFERVGGHQTIRVDVRVIAATNRDLEQAIRGSTFRADLYYRLSVVPIRLPPLRERRGGHSAPGRILCAEAWHAAGEARPKPPTGDAPRVGGLSLARECPGT